MKIKPGIKTGIFISVGIIGTFLILLSALFIVSGVFTGQKYLDPWNKQYSQKFSDPRIRLSAVGLLAASGHNMQPWKLSFDQSDPMVFYLYADSSRITKEVDMDARQMMISQGTFLEYIRIAGEQQGWHTGISLFPDGIYDEKALLHSMDTKPVARITLSKAQPASSPLYPTIFLPDTNRSAYQQIPLTSEQVQAFENLSIGQEISVKLFQDDLNLKQIGKYAMQSAEIEAGVTRIIEESTAIFRSNEYQKNKYRYGYSLEGQGTSGLMKHLLQGILTIVPSLNAGDAASQNFIKATRTSVENTPSYAMIISSDNSRIEQVKSGMLYSRLVLTGHILGLAMQPLSQVLEEFPEMKQPYTEFKDIYAPHGGTVQMLFRVGVPTEETSLSMRRDVQSLITEK